MAGWLLDEGGVHMNDANKNGAAALSFPILIFVLLTIFFFGEESPREINRLLGFLD